MENFLKQNWFKVGILVALAVFVYYQSNFSSTKELYTLNSDCAQKAISFAKNKTDSENRAWTVKQSIFNVDKKSCFGEFNFGNYGEGITHTIYDLFLNKELVFLPELTGKAIMDEMRAFNERASEYEKAKSEIFEK